MADTRTLMKRFIASLRRRVDCSLCARSPSCAALAAAVWLRIGPLPAGLLERRSHVRRRSSSIGTAKRLYEARSTTGTRSERIDAAIVAGARWRSRRSRPRTRGFAAHVGVDPIAVVARGVAQLPHRPGRAKADRRSRSRSQAAARSTGRRGAAADVDGEDPRGRRRAAARASPDEGRDSRALPEPGAVRQSDRGRRARGTGVLRPKRRVADAGGSGVPRRAAATADALQPVARPTRRRARARRASFGRWRSRLAVGRRLRDRARGAADAQPRAGASRSRRISSSASSPTPIRAGRAASTRRSTRRCSGPCRASSPHDGGRSSSITRRTSPSPCSTTARASGSPGRDRATTSTAATAARSTAWSRRGSRDRR